MKHLITLASGSLLLIAATATAQTTSPSVPAQPASPADTATEAPADTATDAATGDGFDVGPAAPEAAAPEASAGAATSGTYTDDQITAFAAAASAISALGAADTPEKQQQARDIVASPGITVETYNAIGTAMQSDEALAARVQLAWQTSAAQPEG